MRFLSKATLFAYMIVFLPSLLTNVLVWGKLFILDSILLAYLLRPRCQTLLYLHFITEERLSTAVWVIKEPTPCSVVCVARCLVCNHSVLHLPFQGDGVVGLLSLPSFLPHTIHQGRIINRMYTKL